WNVFNFYNTYADKKVKSNQVPKSKNILDKWIVSRLNQLILEVSKAMDNYELDRAAKPLSEFVDDFSTWYLRRSRRRLQKPENKKDFIVASQTLGYVLFEFSKIAAPFIPFVAEALYKSFAGGSVHLQNWPAVDKKTIDNKLLGAMKEARNFANLALAKRAELGIKVRQPLASLKIKNQKSKIKNKELLDILADEVNVKQVIFDSQIGGEIELDTTITPELKAKGSLREFVRMVQDLRQNAGYHHKDKMELFIEAPAEIEALLRNFEKTLKKEIGTEKIEFKKTDKFDAEIQTKFENQPIWLAVKKI
ncbi:class I tRNA ligase family protein, partial [Candidatus Wolfebacteria bacterium]|nr:class I tRNA ligase family protein [Candidatus Wolfebacteria bacterium]